MSEVKKLQLFQVRSHQRADFSFVNGMNAIVGPNGSGKTTILEALYTVLRGSSFRGSLAEIMTYGKNQYKIDLELNADTSTFKRSLTYLNAEQSSQKKWQIEGKNYARLPVSQRLPVVLFEPDLARLITGGPERRRNYLDSIAGQLDIEVAGAQSRFERALKQRNQLLKSYSPVRLPASQDLFVWNTQLAHLAEQIVAARLALIKELQVNIETYYKQLGGTANVTLAYNSTVSSDVKNYGSRLLQFFETSLSRDVALGHTSFGPHRDDLDVLLADQPAKERASRGEVRTVVIALKLLETDLLAKRFAQQNIKPILLLDDVLSELDLKHQEQVLAGFKDYQVFITTTDAHALTPGTHTIGLD